MSAFLPFIKLELRNLFGINVYRHTKNPADKKRRTLLLGTIVLLIVMAVGYLTAGAYMCAKIGIGRFIPFFYTIAAAAIILFLGILKARTCLYRERDRELLSSLPIRSLSVAAARLVRMYIEGLAVAVVVLVPTLTVYAVWMKPGASFYVCAVLTILLVPILPTAVAAWIGILFAAVISRMRHKVLAEVVLVVIVVIGGLLLPAVFTGGNAFSVNLSTLSESSGKTKAERDAEVMAKLSAEAGRVMDKMESSMPVVKTGVKIASKNVPATLGIGLASLVVLLLTAMVIGRNLFAISGRLAPSSVHREYRPSDIRQRSVMASLVSMEAKRYTSIGIYIANTIVGPVLMVGMAIGFGFISSAKLAEKTKQIPIKVYPEAAFPFLIAIFVCVMSITASSVSIEGKNRWIPWSLPVASETIWDAKLLFNLLVLAPFYVITEIILLFTVRADASARLWLLLIPLVYCTFSVVFGLWCNLKFPKFSWENATEVVKQSAAAGVSMLGLFAAAIPGLLVCVAPQRFTNLACTLAAAVIIAVTAMLYRKIRRTKLTDLN